MKWLFVAWIHRISHKDVSCVELEEKGILSFCKHATPLIGVVSVLLPLSWWIQADAGKD